MIQKGSYRSPMVGWAFAPYAREYEHSSIAIAAASAGVGTGGSASAVSATPTVPAAGIAHPAVDPGHRGARPGHGLHRQHGPRTGRARRHRRDASRHGSRLCVGESRCGRTGAIQAGQPSQPAQPGFAMPTMHTLALNHVNFTLREGETVAVMGPSGSGKSTLLHALAGIIKPTAGTVIFRGADLSRMSDAERTKLRRNDFGFVFQSGQLLPELRRSKTSPCR